jgi:hypothetical protein
VEGVEEREIEELQRKGRREKLGNKDLRRLESLLDSTRRQKLAVPSASSASVTLSPEVSSYLRSRLGYDDAAIKRLETKMDKGGARDADIVRVGALGALNEDDGREGE